MRSCAILDTEDYQTLSICIIFQRIRSIFQRPRFIFQRIDRTNFRLPCQR
jgi:hypothetical protein